MKNHTGRTSMLRGLFCAPPREARHHHSEADQRIREYAIPEMNARDNSVRSELRQYVDERTQPAPVTNIYLSHFILPVANVTYQFDSPPPTPDNVQLITVHYRDAAGEVRPFLGEVVRVEHRYQLYQRPNGRELRVFASLVFVEAQSADASQAGEFDIARYIDENGL